MTTSLVLAERANAAGRRPYRAAVAELRASLILAGAIIEPTAEDWERAWQNYARGDAIGAGVVDHVSCLMMRRYNLVQAFTNDRHFLAGGFEVLF